MRHAKSSWKEAGLTDFQRPLNNRGKRVAPQMAEFIYGQGLVPDKIVSSTASRAKGTSELIVEHCKGVEMDQLELIDDFYHAPASVYLEYLGSFADESVNNLMFVGHNPGLEALLEKLSGQWEIMPTATVAHFDLMLDNWTHIDDNVYAELRNVWRPKEIDIY